MSRLDKSRSRAVYEVTLDAERQLPVHVRMLILAGRRGEGKDARGCELGDVEHVVFRGEYTLTGFDEIEHFEVPKEVRQILQ